MFYVNILPMPIIKSAIKKMRKDKKRTEHNKEIENKVKGLIKNVRRAPDAQKLSEVFSALDKAAKTNLIPKNRASRLKSRLSKLMAAPAK